MFTDRPSTIEEKVESERKEIVDHIRHFITVWESIEDRKVDQENYKPLKIMDINNKFNLVGEDILPYDGLRIIVGQIDLDRITKNTDTFFLENTIPVNFRNLVYAKHIVTILKDLPEPTYVGIYSSGNYFTLYYPISILGANKLVYVQFIYIERCINSRPKMNVSLGENNGIIIKQSSIGGL